MVQKAKLWLDTAILEWIRAEKQSWVHFAYLEKLAESLVNLVGLESTYIENMNRTIGDGNFTAPARRERY